MEMVGLFTVGDDKSQLHSCVTGSDVKRAPLIGWSEKSCEQEGPLREKLPTQGICLRMTVFLPWTVVEGSELSVLSARRPGYLA